MDASKPYKWGADELTRFLDLAHHASRVSFVKLHDHYEKLSKINDAFGEAIASISHTNEELPTILLMRSHASYLASVRLAMATEICESYMVLRGCLESALYGLYVSRNSMAREKWYCRNDSEEALREMKKEFRIVVIMKYVDKIGDHIGSVIRELYERTIDYGGHPNPRGVMGTMRVKGNEHDVVVMVDYITDNQLQIELAMKTAAQVGIGVLKLFEAVFTKQFKRVGLSERIVRLSEGL